MHAFIWPNITLLQKQLIKIFDQINLANSFFLLKEEDIPDFIFENISLFFILIDQIQSVMKKSNESVSNFIEKTYNILESEVNSDIVCWTPKGESFLIKDVKKF